jgi:osmotically-inducible protein OsmY
MRLFMNVVLLASLPVFYGCAAAVIGGAAAGGYLVGEDRRPAGVMTDDQTIEFRVSNRIAEKKISGAHVNSTSYNKLVLLTGEVPTAEAKAEIERIVREIPNVRGTYNELTVGPPKPLSSRTNDSYLTSLVKTRFVDAQRFNPVHVKVVTEDSTVYLMGILKRPEADAATELARTARGVRRVVRVFEYQD